MAVELPLPHMDARSCAGITLLTDDALASSVGVRAAFTGAAGGVSAPPYQGLNLGSHVGDDLGAVERNRGLLLQALGVPDAQLIVPNQVHGVELVDVPSRDEVAVEAARAQAQQEADGLVVTAPDVAALLCFADCLPLVMVSPDGSFAVVHAGWRGAVAGIAGLAARRLEAVSGCSAAGFNAYIGPHIRQECFQTGRDVAGRFLQAFGPACVPDPDHVSLAEAVATDLERAGLVPERIWDAGVCTKCHPHDYYSYRASGGVCGRHGAIAVRTEGRSWA